MRKMFSMEYPLQLMDAYKSFDAGQNYVLNGVNFELSKGTITGLLGRNGAGKTTLIRMAVGLLEPDSGWSNLFGYQAWNCPALIRRKVGYVAQQFDDMLWLSVQDALSLVGSFYDQWDCQLVERLRVDWEVPKDRKIQQLSLGQQQKVSILMAIGHRPDLLILDEPVASLDPAARHEFLRMLLLLNDEIGQTILFSSHITTDIERVAADVAVLHAGKITYHGGLDELKESVQCLFLHADTPLVDLHRIDGVVSSRIDGNRMQVWVRDWDEAKQDSLRQLLVQTGSIKQDQADCVATESMGLEELFLGMTS